MVTIADAEAVGLSLAAGLHAACHGAWKDSPSEGFKSRSFMREFVIATLVGIALSRIDHLTTPFVIYLSAYTLNRIVFEFYKMFFRSVPQEVYRIPTQVHFMGRVVTNRLGRAVLGLGWLSAIYGLYCLLKLLPDDMSPSLVGPIAGITFGAAIAVGGGYKDGSVTHFYLQKFLRSPANGALAGVLVAMHSADLPFLALGAIAGERMLSELQYKMLNPGYVGGHFKSLEPPFPEWVTRRRVFVVPYALTWGLFIWLWTVGRHPWL